MKPTKENMLKAFNAAARACAVNSKDLFGKSRQASIVMAKQAALLVICKAMATSPSNIGRTLGMNISTIYHAINTAECSVKAADTYGRKLAGIVAETESAIRNNNRVVKIEVVCGTVFVRSKPDDVDVEIITKQ